MATNVVITSLWAEEDRDPVGRAATPALWPVLQALWASGERDWLAPYLVKAVVERGHLDALLRPSAAVSRWFVATDDEQIVGFTLLIQQRVMALWVRPEMRWRGVGRQLVETAKRVAQHSGYPFLEIEYPDGNEMAVSFCRALGFRPASRRTVAIDGQRSGSRVVFTLLARRYTYPRWVRVLIIVAVAMFAYFTILSSLDSEARLTMWFFLVVTLAMAANLLWSERVIWTDADGIYSGYLNGRLRHMLWADLRVIESDMLEQTFTLRGDHGKIHVSLTMTGIAWLFDTARLARPDLWRKSDRRVFRFRPIWAILSLAFSAGWWAFLIVAAIYGPGGAMWQWLLLAALGFVPLAVLLQRPYRLQIEGDALRVRYLRREEIIPATAIADIWTMRAGTVAISNLALELHLVDGRRLGLGGFEGGTGEMANTLMAWWQRAQADEPQ